MNEPNQTPPALPDDAGNVLPTPPLTPVLVRKTEAPLPPINGGLGGPLPVLVGDTAKELLASVGWSKRMSWRTYVFPIAFPLVGTVLLLLVPLFVIDALLGRLRHSTDLAVMGLFVLTPALLLLTAGVFHATLRRLYQRMYDTAAIIAPQRGASSPSEPALTPAMASRLLHDAAVPAWFRRSVFAVGVAFYAEGVLLALFALYSFLQPTGRRYLLSSPGQTWGIPMSCVAILLFFGAARLTTAAWALSKMERIAEEKP